MPQYFLRPNHFNSEVIQKSRSAIDKDVYYVDDPRDQVNHIICGAKQVFSNCDAKRNDNHRVYGYKDDENLPSTPLLAMLNDRYFPLFGVLIAWIELGLPLLTLVEILLQLSSFNHLRAVSWDVWLGLVRAEFIRPVQMRIFLKELNGFLSL